MRSLTGGLELYAEHQSYLYNGYLCKPLIITRDHMGIPFESARDVFNAIRGNAIPYVASNQFVWNAMIGRTSPRTEPPKVPTSLRSVLLGWYAQEYGCEFDVYRTVITAKDRLGADNGASIRYAVNMLDLGADDIVDDYASGIVPYWGAQGDSSRPLTMLSDGYIAYTPAAYFPIRKLLPVDFSDYFRSQPTETALRDAANAYAAENAVPYIPRSISAERIERPGDRPINLGDDITVANSAWRMTTKVRAVGVTFDALRKRVVGVELGKLNPGFAGAVRRTK
jgi:phage-related protein